MRNSPTWLLSIEIISVLCWLSFAGIFLFEHYTDDGLQPISLEALEMSSSEERWNGIFFQEQHVGYSVAKSTTGSDGIMLLEQRSLFHVATFGQLQQIVTAGNCTVLDLTDSVVGGVQCYAESPLNPNFRI